jgi:hypothetical protein
VVKGEVKIKERKGKKKSKKEKKMSAGESLVAPSLLVAR